MVHRTDFSHAIRNYRKHIHGTQMGLTYFINFRTCQLTHVAPCKGKPSNIPSSLCRGDPQGQLTSFKHQLPCMQQTLPKARITAILAHLQASIQHIMRSTTYTNKRPFIKGHEIRTVWVVNSLPPHSSVNEPHQNQNYMQLKILPQSVIKPRPLCL